MTHASRTRRGLASSYWQTTVVLLSLAILPSFFMMVLGASSLALGLVSACALIVFGLVPSIATLTITPNGVRAAASRIAFWVGLLAAHSIIAAAVVGKFDWARAAGSATLVLVVAEAAAALASHFRRQPSSTLARVLMTCYYALVAVAALAIIGVPAFAPTLHNAPVVFFIEPSHFSLSFLPFAAFAALSQSGLRKALNIGISLFVGLQIQSMTLLVGLTLILVLALPMRQILLIGTCIVLGALSIDLDYYTNRLVISDDVQNLSSLAFLQGWERAWLNLGETHGIGVGFQQFGLSGSLGELQVRIEQFFGSNINLLDGGTVGSKLIGEFGWIGVLLLAAYLWIAGKAVRTMRAFRSGSESSSLIVFQIACIFSVGIEIFIRGGGYMTPGALLLFCSLSRPKSTVSKKPHKTRLASPPPGRSNGIKAEAAN